MSWSQIDITDLAHAPGATKTVRTSEVLEDFRSGLGGVKEDKPVKLDLVADSVPEGVQVSGTVSGQMRLSCSRCLVEFVENFEQRVDETFYYELGEEAEGYEVKDLRIDVEPMLRDLIVLNIPVRPLHREDCKGLCQVCGADRNIDDCGHDTNPVDIRWAPLEKLRLRNSSVELEEE